MNNPQTISKVVLKGHFIFRMREASGLVRTSRLFGGLLNDLKRKKPFYISDFLHGLHPQVFFSVCDMILLDVRGNYKGLFLFSAYRPSSFSTSLAWLLSLPLVHSWEKLQIAGSQPSNRSFQVCRLSSFLFPMRYVIIFA